MAVNQNEKEKPATENIHPEYMSIAALAEYGSISKSTLRKWLLVGMPYYKLGRSIRIKRSDFDGWLEQFRVNGTPKDNRRKNILGDVIAEVRK